ncbi:MAG: ATP-binding protein [Bacillota bacterium]
MYTSPLAAAAARFGHHLKNELALARAALQLAMQHCRDDPGVRYLQRALGAIDSAVRLADVTEVAQLPGAVQMKPVDLVHLSEGLLEVLSPRFEQTGVQAVWAGAPTGGPVRVSGDETLLALALTNVLVNAIEATPPGGRVTVKVAGEGATGSWAELTVQDSGPGFAPELLGRILREPVTTKGPGNTGWGLLIVREIVEGVHGGRVEVGNAPEGGAVCRIHLPRGQEQACAT